MEGSINQPDNSQVQNPIGMAKIELISTFIDELRKQGILIIVMCLAIFYFYNKQEKLEEKIDKNNSEYIDSIKKNSEDYKNLTIQMMEAIDRNTKALEKIEDRR